MCKGFGSTLTGSALKWLLSLPPYSITSFANLDGKSVFTMGGGESPDIDIRSENDGWSRDEIPSQDELLEGAKNLEKHGFSVDIVVTHEPPTRIKGFLQLKDYDMLRVTALNAYFEELSDSCKFSKWFFGSMHVDKYISGTHTPTLIMP